MDVFLQVTRDGGKTFELGETAHDKHSDNHALWIDPDNPRHLRMGTDAGVYESFDDGATWRLFPNMPISQFSKIALNNREPFYDVLGGAQDLGTLHGPPRTMNQDGIRNQDWYVPLGADGHGVAFDPRDPDLTSSGPGGHSLARTVHPCDSEPFRPPDLLRVPPWQRGARGASALEERLNDASCARPSSWLKRFSHGGGPGTACGGRARRR